MGGEHLVKAPPYMMTVSVALQRDAADRLIRFVEELRADGITVSVSGPPSSLVLAELAAMRAALERRLEREPGNTEALELIERVAHAEAMQRFIQRFAEPHS